jgi:hypothetical protein
MQHPAFACLLVVATAAPAVAQPTAPRQMVGTGITGGFQSKDPGGAIVDTSRLEFRDGAGAIAFTVDFVVQYERQRPAVPPSVVDVVITEYTGADEQPEMTIRVDGRPVDMHPRLRSRRSVVASIPFDAFVALTAGETIVERAFDTDLVFSSGQTRMLRSVAQRWAGNR